MRSVRFRLTVWYAVLLLAALAIFSAAIWMSLRTRLLHDHDAQIQASVDRFRTYFIKETATHLAPQITDELDEYCQALPPSTFLDLSGSDGYQFHYPPRRRNHPRHSRWMRTQFSANGNTYRLEGGASSRDIYHTLDLLRFLLLSLIPVVVGVACLGGAWMSRRALRPVDEVTSAAKNIGIENLSQRLPVPPTGDELARLTEVWNTMLERLDSAVKTLSQFAADASHELRTPLAVIRTSAELSLRRERSPEAYRESLREIATEAERMTELVEELLFLARTETGNGGLIMEPVELRELLIDVTRELQDFASTRGIHFALNASPATVSGNRAALRRMFSALIDNAIKYSPEGSPVEVTLRTESAKAEVEVRDRGSGIPPEDLPHIFGRFYRSDKARSNGGHGLGLALASTIATAHAGAISAENGSEGGATFRVSLPIR